jgi:succinoglycan biosynthesis protein ExoL
LKPIPRPCDYDIGPFRLKSRSKYWRGLKARNTMKLAYFAQDLSDPATQRRLRMLRMGGANAIALLGFRRSAERVGEVEGVPAIDLGRTRDARLGRRAGSVLRAAAALPLLRNVITGSTVFMARNLEMLALASEARRRFAPDAALVYECLDIHQMMLSTGVVGTALRSVERRLVRSCDLLTVSSPAYGTEYFAKVHRALPATYLLENKVLSSETGSGSPALLGRGCAPAALPAPPWRIGWFGNMRCRRSLHLLAALANRFPGRIEVVIRGQPSLDAIPDFHEVVAATPGLVFHGPYNRSTDLAAIYADVHFTWALDFYEAGANGDWALANRLYEGGLHHSVPIAQRSVEMGRWLADRGTGILVDEPFGETLEEYFAALDPQRYAEAKMAAARLPASHCVHDAADCAAFVKTLALLAERKASSGGVVEPPALALGRLFRFSRG